MSNEGKVVGGFTGNLNAELHKEPKDGEDKQMAQFRQLHQAAHAGAVAMGSLGCPDCAKADASKKQGK